VQTNSPGKQNEGRCPKKGLNPAGVGRTNKGERDIRFHLGLKGGCQEHGRHFVQTNSGGGQKISKQQNEGRHTKSHTQPEPCWCHTNKRTDGQMKGRGTSGFTLVQMWTNLAAARRSKNAMRHVSPFHHRSHQKTKHHRVAEHCCICVGNHWKPT